MVESTDQLIVTSTDGTRLAVWISGAGPPMVLVHGSFGDHTAWDVPLEVMNERYTTYAMDRRGFGASSDQEPYSIQREFDDVTAVVEAVADASDESAIVWGHSYGANCAMGGASRSTAVRNLVLYEPSLGLTYPAGAIEAAETALIKGDRDGAVRRMLLDVLEMSPEEVGALKASPRWPNLLANAHTTPRECRVEETWVYGPGQFSTIEARTLLLSGTESPKPLRDATTLAGERIPGAIIESLQGHGHFAHRTHPAMVAGIIAEFIGE